MNEELEYYKVRDSSHIKIIKAMAEQIEKLEKELAFMEGEYPEPTIAAKILEFSSLEQAYNRIAKYEQVLQSIANEQVELSHDKIKWQCEDHIRWAKDVLSSSGNNAEDVGNTEETLPKGKV